MQTHMCVYVYVYTPWHGVDQIGKNQSWISNMYTKLYLFTYMRDRDRDCYHDHYRDQTKKN